LATILATHGNWPEIPPEYSINLHPVREKVGSLMQMAAAAVCRNRVPWRALFQDALRAGQDHRNPFDMLEVNAGSYVIPPPEVKYSRRSSRIPEGRTVRLSTGTLIIIPQNLLSQWRTEISNHVEIGRLQILYLESGNETLMPPVNTLLKYDIILMSRPRFEKEMVPSESIKASSRTRKARGGCMCSLDEDCNCSKGDDYRSPLMDIHWLRIVMDEGHEFSSSGRAGTAYWALQNLRVDRKWIVSGTPASGLMGVEVGAAIQETSKSVPDDDHTSNRQYLEAWRKESVLMQERKDLEKLGVLVSGFLQVKPWANSKEEDPASWQKYILPYQDGRRKAGSLKRLLESLVVRHRIEDIEADIQLPPLYNRVAYLQPSGHDKLSMNLFILSLAANAVTSERVDEDYMFHSKNRRQLNILISSLRQGGFYWTSIPPEAISQTMKVSRAYLERHEGKSSSCSDADRILLEKAIEIGELALGSDSWRSFADLHEMGIYVAGFPEQAQSAWSLVPMQTRDLLLTGITQLAEAQRWVDSHLYASDPASGLAELGVSTMQKLWQAAQRDSGTSISEETVLGNDQINHSPHSKGYSSLAGLPRLTRERTVSRAKVALIPQNSKNAALARQPPTLSGTDKPTGLKSALKSALRTPVTANPVELLPSDSPLAKSKLCGTASAKLTYLLDRVTVLHQTEKVLIFYEGDQIAWYIAQALDLIDIRYLIYTKTLSLARQAAYITTFNGTETFRVLLMNVHQAAHGLHIASASRVFFVNPVWQPNVEAQAIKRAHRIGQTRPVYVETLVLKDTLEDQMLQRRKGMTPQEHQKAERSLLDDDTMSTIIKRAHFIPLLDEEIHDVSKQMAKLETCHQLFARSGKGGGGDVDDPDADLIFPEDMPVSEKQKQKKTRKISRKIVAQAASLPSIIPPVQNLGRADGLPNPSLSNTDREEAGASGSSIEKHKIDLEHRPDLENSAPLKRIAVGRAVSGGSVGSSKHSVASLVPSSQSLPQDSATSSNSAGRSKKRVGFALDAARLSEDEPPSLFGDGSPATSSIGQRGSDDGHAPQVQFAATATGLLVEESARDVESGGSASRKGVKFFVTDT